MRGIAILATLAIVTLSCAGTPPIEEQPTVVPSEEAPTAAPVEEPATTVPAGDVPTAAKAPPAFPKLDRTLNAVLASSSPLDTATDKGCRVLDERIQVTIVTDADQVAEVQTWLEESDAQQVSSSGDELQAHVSIDLLRKLNRHPAIRLVKRPIYVTDPGLQREP